RSAGGGAVAGAGDVPTDQFHPCPCGCQNTGRQRGVICVHRGCLTVCGEDPVEVFAEGPLAGLGDGAFGVLDVFGVAPGEVVADDADRVAGGGVESDDVVPAGLAVGAGGQRAAVQPGEDGRGAVGRRAAGFRIGVAAGAAQRSGGQGQPVLGVSRVGVETGVDGVGQHDVADAAVFGGDVVGERLSAHAAGGHDHAGCGPHGVVGAKGETVPVGVVESECVDRLEPELELGRGTRALRTHVRADRFVAVRVFAAGGGELVPVRHDAVVDLLDFGLGDRRA